MCLRMLVAQDKSTWELDGVELNAWDTHCT